MKDNLAVLFSGGRTSAYMSKWIKDNWMEKYHVKFVYCNTGQEHPSTLDFVNKCDDEFGLNLTWIEADIRTKGIGTNYKEVFYEIASLDGKPFEDMIKKFGLPNKDFPHCTRELKIEPFKKWAKDVFNGESYVMALGIRVDEPKRLKQSKTDAPKVYPLAVDHPMTKEMILVWWKHQNFDLQIPEHLGNCTWCWKKSDRKLYTLAKEYPEIFEFPKMLDSKYAVTSNFERKDKRQMFRRYRTTIDILNESTSQAFVPFYDPNYIGVFEDECAEECGSFHKGD